MTQQTIPGTLHPVMDPEIGTTVMALGMICQIVLCDEEEEWKEKRSGL